MKYINYEEIKHQLKYDPGISFFRNNDNLIYRTVSRTLNFAIDSNRRLTTNTANFFLVGDIEVSIKCIMAIFNSKIFNRLNKLLFGDKVNRVNNIKKLPIPILDEDQQRRIEKYVDDEDYAAIEEMLADFFQISDSKIK